MSKTSKATVVESKKEEKQEVKDIITTLLDVMEAIDVDALNKVKEEQDTELRRSGIANLIIKTAHASNQLAGIKTVSTMREVVYNLLATDTQRSQAFHRELGANPKATLEDIASSPKAVLVFSAMYPRQYSKYIKV